MDEQISQEERNSLIEDVSYLQDEAEAMQYVIDHVPYTERPPEGRSIAEMLLLMDHAQKSYYRPIVEDVLDKSRPVHLENYTHSKESFEANEEQLEDVQKILSKLAKHRAGFTNTLKDIFLIDWETTLYDGDHEISLYTFIKKMIRFERDLLKEIADQVKVFNQEKERQREIESRRAQREELNSSEN